MALRFKRGAACRARAGVAAVLLFTLTGCKNIVDVDVPTPPPTLALYGFVHPDAPVQLDVYRTAEMGESTTTEALRLTDAEVTVAAAQQQEVLRYVPGKGYAGSGLVTSPGQTYRVEVSRPGFETVRAETTIPARPQVQVQTRNLGLEDGYFIFEITLTIDDPAGENYYRLGMFRSIPPERRTQGVAWEHVSFTASDVSLRTNPADVGGQRLEEAPQSFRIAYIGDAAFDGSAKQLRLLAQYRDFELPTHASLVVTSMGRDYFAYHRDLELQRRNLDDPFAEPVALFSNVEDGAGVFGSYANTVTPITFR